MQDLLEQVIRGGQLESAEDPKLSMDVYFSADVETDGAIPGPYSMLSFALVSAGSYDGQHFTRPTGAREKFYAELRPISEILDPEALAVNGVDRDEIKAQGEKPETVMTAASDWFRSVAGSGRPVL